MNKMRDGKAPELDQCAVGFVRKWGRSMVAWLVRLLNCCIETGGVLRDWKGTHEKGILLTKSRDKVYQEKDHKFKILIELEEFRFMVHKLNYIKHVVLDLQCVIVKQVLCFKIQEIKFIKYKLFKILLIVLQVLCLKIQEQFWMRR